MLACAFQYQYRRVQSDHLFAYSKFRDINESQSKLAMILCHRATNNTIYVTGLDISIINYFFIKKALPREICVFAKIMMLYFVSD